MTLNDQLNADAISIFGDTSELAEAVTYRTYVNPTTFTEATVNAVVFRNKPERIVDGIVGLAYDFEVFIPNDATVGTTAVQKGKDELMLSKVYGGTPARCTIAEIIANDAGGWHLGVRG